MRKQGGLVEVVTDGSQIQSGQAAAAAIIRTKESYLPVKILGFLGEAESSKAELWAVILGIGMFKFLNFENVTLKWISDSKTTIDCLSKELGYWSSHQWKNRSGSTPKHLDDWQTLNQISLDLLVCCVHKQRSTKHRDLSACDKASRWAAHLGESINASSSLQGKNSVQDPRYAWQVIPLNEVLKLNPTERIKKLNQLFDAIEVYKK